MKKILVCAIAHAQNCPRPLGMLNALSGEFQVSYFGLSCDLSSVKHEPLYRRDGRVVKILRLAYRFFRVHTKLERLSYGHSKNLDFSQYDLIVCHDVELLPFLFSQREKPNVLLDAREYYPRHFESSPYWRFMQAPFQDYLCKKYLPAVAKSITVSSGLRTAYLKNYNVDMDVFFSLPPKHDLLPAATTEVLRLVHHGAANPLRKIELMIYAMDDLVGKAELDLMLVGEGSYYIYLENLCARRPNVTLRRPVAYDDIIPTLNQYNIGLVFFPAEGFNLRHCMPNKLFEFVQAGLGVVAAPLEDVSRFVVEHGIGIVSQTCTSQSLAVAIASMHQDDVRRFQNQSRLISEKFNQSVGEENIRSLVGSLLSKP